MLLRDKSVHFQNLQMDYNRDQNELEQVGTIVDETIMDDLLYMVVEIVDFVVDHADNVYIKNHIDSQ